MKKLVSFDYTEVVVIREAIEDAAKAAHSLAINSLIAYGRTHSLSESSEKYYSQYQYYMEKKKKFESLLQDL